MFAKGKEGNLSKVFVDMPKYIENTSEENVTNKDIYPIYELVEKAKHRKKVGIQYIRLWEENERMRKEMLAKGYVEGHAEERNEGMRILINTY